MKKNIDLGKTKFTKEEVAWINYFKQELELIRSLQFEIIKMLKSKK